MQNALPAMVRIRRNIHAPKLSNPEATAKQEMLGSGLHKRIRPGMRIAVGCGSRGIACYAEIVKGVIAALREAGARPFIFPAMGSHGGATAEGQVAVLATAGITEESMGVPVLSDMDAVQLGQIPDGPAVWFDRNAATADGIVVVNRVKAHTDFRSDLASGLIKMLVIGCGKEIGARAIHTFGVRGLREYIPEVAKITMAKLPILPGLAIIENAYEKPAMLRALPPESMFAGEKELLVQARQLMGRLPVDELDVLILDQMGKDISGSGMDTNVIGRLYITGEDEFSSPYIRRIGVLDLTDASHGNAVGVGLADVISERLRRKINEQATNLNSLTSTFLERGRIPVTVSTDRDVVDTAIHCAWPTDRNCARVIRAKSTLELADLFVSTAVLEELAGQPGIEQLSEPRPWHFTPDGTLEMPW